MEKNDHDDKQGNGYSRRGFMQFIGVGAGVVGASLLSPPLRQPLKAEDVGTIFPASEMVKVRLAVNGTSMPCLWSLAGPCFMCCVK